ncbi:phage virion morphogenesis protein [Pseudoxanthomonas sp.]|uniref:phage virion morphogenesis protein n=1 Tax=Pseudoxanthomonas sp. TaxID=1871049 RepID=UPI0025F60980|nr:phage virion morphogenesis protein [Pseudoxanthomonas sp.]
MTDTLIIAVDDAQVQRWFGKLIERGLSLAPLMADVGELLLESTQGRFDTGTGPDGIAWVPLADGSGRTPLSDTRRMRDDISPSSGADWVELSAHARQARWHQEGTKPYTIKPKDKKALTWPGGPGPRGKVNHPGLPARPFMGLSQADGEGIDRLAIAWLELGDAAGVSG